MPRWSWCLPAAGTLPHFALSVVNQLRTLFDVYTNEHFYCLSVTISYNSFLLCLLSVNLYQNLYNYKCLLWLHGILVNDIWTYVLDYEDTTHMFYGAHTWCDDFTLSSQSRMDHMFCSSSKITTTIPLCYSVIIPLLSSLSNHIFRKCLQKTTLVTTCFTCWLAQPQEHWQKLFVHSASAPGLLLCV